MSTPTTGWDTLLDLATARALATAGVPIFVARPALDDTGAWDPHGGHNGCGYWLPDQWQHTVADPAAVGTWREGDALAAVMGHMLDALDTDPRNGGTESRNGLRDAGMWPQVYGVAATPSGGTHELVAPLWVGSRDGVLPGLDVKGGRPDGRSRGFVFIAPTVKLSKTTGEVTAYRWATAPMLDELDPGDDSGAAIAELVRQAPPRRHDR